MPLLDEKAHTSYSSDIENDANQNIEHSVTGFEDPDEALSDEERATIVCYIPTPLVIYYIYIYMP